MRAHRGEHDRASRRYAAARIGPAPSGNIAQRSRNEVCLCPARVRDEASDNQDGTRDKPRQRIQMLVTARGGRRMPAGRARTISLHPRHVEEKGPGTRKQAEG